MSLNPSTSKRRAGRIPTESAAVALAVAALLPGCTNPGAREKPAAPGPQQLAAFGTQAAPLQQPRRAGRVIVKVRGGIDQGLSAASASASGAISVSQVSAASAAAGALLNRHGARSAAPLFAARQRLKRAGMTDAQIDARVRRRFAARTARAPQNAAMPDLGGFYVLELGEKSPVEMQAALAALRLEPEIVSAQEDRVVKATLTPNDPSYPSLWAMPKIRASTAWDTARGAGVTVAVTDSGVDYNHPDLDANIWLNPGEIAGNGLDDDGNGLVDDVRGWDFIGPSYLNPSPDNDPMDAAGHGTHVAGTVAAEGNNGLGVIGVAWQAKVMALRGLDDGGNGLESTLAPAIIYAADEGADVINASWGGEGQSDIIEAAINHAHGLGALFVAAAGNSSKDVAGFYPANAPRAVAVSATDEADQRPSFSNTGTKVDVSAPGVNILSTFPNNAYVSQQGTSMAAPHVSGVAALIVQLHPTYSAEQIRQVLRTSSIDLQTPGFDPISGYGRVDAANAVAATQVPVEAKLFSPHDKLAVRGPTPLVGSAQGPGYHHHVVEFGPGYYPNTFTQLVSSTTPVNNGTLFTWDPSTLPDGTYTVRLRVFTTGGLVYQDWIQVVVRFLEISSPTSSPMPAFTDVRKAGSTISILGRATGGSFISYNLQWAPGRYATSGFSTSGITLAVPGGSTPVEDGLLGTWVTPSTVGEYTVKLTVLNDGFASTAESTVYLEPDLVSTNWPQFVAPGGHGSAMLPARAADGTTRIISCAYPNSAGSSCRSWSNDGASSITVDLSFGNYSGPTVGQLDNQPGDEVVLADDRKIRIFTASLAPIREIVTPRDESFVMHRVFLADLDGDGIMEIIATARDTPPGARDWFLFSGSIHVYRADGTLYSPRYPLRLSSPRMPFGTRHIDALAADLDGDGVKEILVVFQDRDVTVFDVIALRADGTAYPWPTVTFSGAIGQFYVADLDHDGHPELVWLESSGGQGQIRVLNHDGTTRPGWPVLADGYLAIGDIDRDGLEEIVNVLGPNMAVFKPDGTIMPVTWPSVWFKENPVIADVDADSFPDILFSAGSVNGSGVGDWFDSRLFAVSRTGAIIKQWRFFGSNGRQPSSVVPAIGDFTGDGKTDIAAKVRLTEGGGVGGWLLNDQLLVLTNNTQFDPENAHWPSPNHDPQQSRARIPGPGGSVILEPVADAHVRDGTSANTNYGTAASMECKNSTAAGNNRRTFLRFSLGTVGSGVTSAKLRLSGNSVTSAKSIGAYAVPNITWGESTITFANAPAIGAKQGGSVSVGLAPAQYYEWDVTSYLQAQKNAGATAVSFELKQDLATSEGPSVFSSREGASKPQLLVTSGPAPVDQPPTVVEGPIASPNPVTGATSTLTVQGADDHGEAALTYTWSVTGTPPAPVGFSVNGSNAAKSSQASFTAAGTYNLQVVVRDAANQTATAPLVVTVLQTLTTVVVTPAAASVATGGTQQFTASGKDQFGATLISQPTFGWTVSGGGSISPSGLFTAGAAAGGPFTVTAASGGKSGTAQVTVTGGGGTVTLNPVADAHVRDGTNAGVNFGTAITLETKNTATAGYVRRLFLRYAIDGFGSSVTQARLRLHGNSVTTAKLIGVYAVSNVTWGETTITFNNAPTIGAKQGSSVSVGLAPAQYREWDVTSYIQAQKTAGATAVTFEVKQDVATGDGPSVFSSREAASNKPQLVVTTGGGTNLPPTVATPAAASPSPAPGTTTALSVLGADDGGEPALTYTWSTTGTPPAAVTFSPNGTNAARNTTATFTKAGNYGFQVVIRDAGSLTVTSSVSMTVSQTLTTVVVAPPSATVAPAGSQQFTATGQDQFNAALTSQPAFSWTVSGGGTISSGGLFTAGATPGGPFTVTAASGGKSGTATVTVSGGGTVTLNPVADAHVRDGTSAGTNFGTAVTLEQKSSTVTGNHRRTFLRFPLTGVGSTITQAKLRLHGASVTAAKLVGVYAISSVSWGETSITFNNAPTIGAKQGSSKSVGLTAAYVEWDLTSYIQAQKTAGATAVSLEVKQDVANNEGPTTFNSRENGSNKPQLVVTSN